MKGKEDTESFKACTKSVILSCATQNNVTVSDHALPHSSDTLHLAQLEYAPSSALVNLASALHSDYSARYGLAYAKGRQSRFSLIK